MANERPGLAPLPAVSAELAGRLTFALAVTLDLVQIAIGALWIPWIRSLYLGLGVAVGIGAYWPRLPPRTRAGFVVGTWVLAGWASLFVAGIREGFVILSVSVALASVFFGVRAALALLGATFAVTVLAASLFVRGVLTGAPSLFTASRHLEAWITHGSVFLGLSTMLVVVHGRIATEQRSAADRARTFTTIAEQSSSALVFTDPDQVIVWSNPAFARLTGFTPEEVLGRRPGPLLQGPGTSSDDRKELRAAIAARRPVTVETVNYGKDQRPYWVRIRIEPVWAADGSLTGFTGSQEDITDARLFRAFDEIDRELAEALARAEGALDFDGVLTRSVAACDAVRYVRVWRPSGRTYSVTSLTRSVGRLPTTVSPSATAPTGDTPRGVLSGPLTDEPAGISRRAFLPIDDEPGGLFEVCFWACMPGPEVAVARLPSLLARAVLLQRRRLDARRLQGLFASSPEALVLLGGDGAVRMANEAAQQLLPALASGVTPTEAQPELGAAIGEVLAVARGDRRSEPLTCTWQSSDGTERVIEVRGSPLQDLAGGDSLIALRDVTERLRQLSDAKAAVIEKDTLLREIHHRVKNNLQIVSSLLDMQLFTEVSPAVRQSLRESVLRIQTMAMVHQSLYGTTSLSRIDFGGFTRRLVENLRSSLAPTARVEVLAEAHEISVERAIPLGLLVNELVTNAFKYGQTAGVAGLEPPRVTVSWRRDDDRYELAVSDEGPGLPPGFDLLAGKTLGLRLMRALARQLAGKLEHRDRGRGSSFVINFPVISKTTGAPAPLG